MGEWISVEDRLPEVNQNVLVIQVYEDEPMIASITRFGYWVEKCINLDVDGDAIWSFEICSVRNANDYEKITHWMSLPEPPKV